MGAFEYGAVTPTTTKTLTADTGHIWYVNDTSTVGDKYTTAVGSDANNGSSSAPFRTITRALSAASAGETIYIDAGTYGETIAINKDGVSLLGADSQSTVLDGGDSSGYSGIKAIYAKNISNVTIKDIGITNAYNGIEFNNIDSGIIENLNVVNCGFYFVNVSNLNITHNYGGGIEIRYSHNNLISDNINGGINLDDYNYENTIKDNIVQGGGGICLDKSWENTIQGNKSMNNDEYHGGFYVQWSDTNIFKDNTAFNNEVGFNIHGSRNNVFKDNTADSNQYGFEINQGSNNVFMNNLAIRNEYGFELFDDSESNTIIYNRIFENKTYGLFLEAGSNTKISNNIFYENFIGAALGIMSNSQFNNNTLYGNLGGIFIQDDSADSLGYPFSAGNNTVKNNLVVSDSAGIYGEVKNIITTNGFKFSYNDVWGGDTLYYNAKAGIGSISKDPKFLNTTDTESSDFLRLSSASPCIDAGDPADAVPSGGGSRIDIGAYEYGAAPGALVTLSADAGNDTTALMSKQIRLNGSGASAIGAQIYYAWRQISGPDTAALFNSSSASPYFTPDTEGEFVFGLRVTDNEDTSAEDTVVVTVISIRADIVNARRKKNGLDISVMSTPQVKSIKIKYSTNMQSAFSTITTLTSSTTDKRLWQTTIPWSSMDTGTTVYLMAVPVDTSGTEYPSKTTIFPVSISVNSKGETDVNIEANGLAADIIDVSLSNDLVNRVPRGKLKLDNSEGKTIKKIYAIYYRKTAITAYPYYTIDARVRIINLNFALRQKTLDFDLRPIMSANRAVFLVIVYENDGKDCVYSKRLTFSRPAKQPSIEDPIEGIKASFKRAFKREVMMLAKSKKRGTIETKKRQKANIASDAVEFTIEGGDAEFYPGQEADIEIPYDDEAVDTQARLKVVFWDEKNDKWSRTGVKTIAIDAINHIAKAVTKHFTEFAVIATTTAPQVRIIRPSAGRYALENAVVVFEASSEYADIDTTNFRVKVDGSVMTFQPAVSDGLDNDNDGTIDENGSDSEQYFYNVSDTAVRFTVKLNSKLAIGKHTLEVTVWDADGVVTDNPAKVSFNVASGLTDLNLAHNYPNPFNPKAGEKAHFELGLSARALVRIRIYDFAGQLVDELGGQEYGPGDEIDWDGTEQNSGEILANGVYFAVIEATADNVTKKKIVKTMILSK